MPSYTQVLAQLLMKAKFHYHWPAWLLLQGRPEEVPTLQQPPQFTRGEGRGSHDRGLPWTGT